MPSFAHNTKFLTSVFATSLLLLVLVLVSCTAAEPEPHTVTFEPTEPATEPLPHDECLEEVCGERDVGPAVGDPFLGGTVFTNNGCSACHHVDSEEKLVGPGLLNISTRADTRVVGQSGSDYLYDSIREPNVFVVDGYVTPSLMPTFAENAIGARDMLNLIAYLDSLT